MAFGCLSRRSPVDPYLDIDKERYSEELDLVPPEQLVGIN